MGLARPVFCLLLAAPLLRLAWLATQNGLGANPLEFVTHSLGTWALVFLLVTLAVTPAMRISGQPRLARGRRWLGLTAFAYASLHLLTYLWWDQFFDWSAILHDIYKRPFITLGLAAYLLLVPLAMTSTDAMMRRLKWRWKVLHRLVYPAAVLAVAHYWWLVKRDVRTPALFTFALALLLAWRLKPATKKRVGSPTRSSPGA